MLSKLSMDFETNMVEEILISLKPNQRKAALKSLKAYLRQKGVKLHSHSDIPALAEEHLSLKEFRTIFRETMSAMRLDTEDVKKLKAYYLEQRFRRVAGSNIKLQKTLRRELKKALQQQGIISEEDAAEWSRLSAKQRFRNIVYNAANHLNYLELEEVFNRVLSPEDSLSIVVKETRNIDNIKKMTSSEILPFLQKIIVHEKEIPGPDKQEALETITDIFISDHHYYKLAANKYFTLTDIYKIIERRICLPDRQGKIGQKAAGMILAHKILSTEKSEFSRRIKIPESYYLTSDVFFESLSSHTYNFSSLKHRLKEGSLNEHDLEEEYPRIRKLILSTVLPDIIRIELRKMLTIIGDKPVIVRSSSLLEDSVSAFSGKYDSFFFANQKILDDPEEDIERRVDILIRKILLVYASVLNPGALIYRRERGLLDIDERMSILIQVVEGVRYGKYFFPAIAGVGLSYNHRMNSARIKWDDPVLRIGFGLGTGIVEMKGFQVKVVYPGNPDYSTILDFYEMIKASQRKFDVLNLETDTVETVTKDTLFHYFNEESAANAAIRNFIRVMGRYFLSTAQQDYLTEGIGLASRIIPDKHVFTLEGMKKTQFYQLTEWALRTLTRKYQPADIEFTVGFPRSGEGVGGKDPHYFDFTLVQCRQLTGPHERIVHAIPEHLAESNIICRADKGIVSGYAPNIRYVIYIDPDAYYELDETRMYSVARLIGNLNYNLRKKRFIVIGPGRWGSSSPYYGIKVTYTEIYHTLGLVEIVRVLADGTYAEPSLGSHFGNDIRESEIVPLSIYPGAAGTVFKSHTFDNCPNLLYEYFKGAPLEDWVSAVIKVIDARCLPAENIEQKKRVLHLVSDSRKQRAVLFLGEVQSVQRAAAQNTRRQITDFPGLGI